MKKVTLIASLFAFGFTFSQEQKGSTDNKLALDFNIGLNKPVAQFSNGYGMKSLNPFHTDLGIRYMLNSRCGLKFDFGMDNFKSSLENYEFTSKYLRFSLQGVLNLGSMLEFHSFTPKFGLLAHGGVGISSLKGDKIGVGKGADDMINVMFGITPQYKVSNKLCVNLDLSLVGHIYQDYTYDFQSTVADRGFDGTLYNLSLGISYSLGKGEKSIDWAEYQKVDNSKLYELENRLAVATQNLKKSTANTTLNPVVTNNPSITKSGIEQQLGASEAALRDSDSDGVADYLDLEPNTPAGVKVDKDGRTAKAE